VELDSRRCSSPRSSVPSRGWPCSIGSPKRRCVSLGFVSLGFDLSYGLFVGVVALVFVGINGLRIAAAGALGFYPDAAFALASVAAAVPAVGGVAVGKRLRDRVSERLRRGTVLGLLTVIGGRLVLGGAGVL